MTSKELDGRRGWAALGPPTNWFATSVPLFLAAAGTRLPYNRNGVAVLTLYAPSVLLLILAALIWILAPAIARVVSRGVDTTVSVGGLSRSDLYSFAFVFLGLFFILSSFANVIDWAHYFATVSHPDARVRNLYQFTGPCITLALGFVSLLGAPSWTKKLVAHDERGKVAWAQLCSATFART
ncbi:MAG: hypothetical protein ACRD5Z_06545 [Bryobacteraceae bacterium]